MPESCYPDVFKGRGAPSSQLSKRFGTETRVADVDWLDIREDIDGKAHSPHTQVTEEFPKSILSFNRSPDLPFDRSINAYRGCEHGCIYCYARPTHAYHDLSPGLDFETKLFAKPDAANLLRQTLAKPNYQPAPIALGTNTDPYQPIERRYRITRSILQLMVETQHPVVITTKSARIVEDIDLLSKLAKDNLTRVAISVTSLNARLSSKLEPRASVPQNRLKTVKSLGDAGIYTHVNIAPLIPAITDHELEDIAEAVAAAGARSLSWIPLRLPHEVAPLFREWLEVHFPDRAKKVMNIVRDMRGNRDNDPRFGHRMRGQGVWAELMRSRMQRLIRKYNLGSSKWHVRTDLFRRPDTDGQMRLF